MKCQWKLSALLKALRRLPQLQTGVMSISGARRPRDRYGNRGPESHSRGRGGQDSTTVCGGQKWQWPCHWLVFLSPAPTPVHMLRP